jgi:Sensors of blue-light using FAD
VTYQIIYSSKSGSPMQTEDLQELLDHSRRSNGANGITGALVYAEGIFLQILEGDKDLLNDLMAKIRQDVRHENVIVLQEGEVPAAVFGGWKMAYVSATPKQVAMWAGVSMANDATESLTDTVEEQNRTTQFAQEILALLMADGTTKGNVH